MGPDKNQPRKTSTVADTLLLVLLCITIFLVPVFPTAYHQRIYDPLFTGIFLTSAFALQRNRRVILALAFFVAIAEWATSHIRILTVTTTSVMSRAMAIAFFVLIVIALIIQIAKTRNVTSRVIIDSINGYLLLGLVFTLMVGLVMVYHPNAFSLPTIRAASENQAYPLSDYFYYTFITFATVGYGDLLPKAPYAKSLAVLIAVVGQLYLTIIIAMLVGKYVATAAVESDGSKV